MLAATSAGISWRDCSPIGMVMPRSGQLLRLRTDWQMPRS